MNTRTIEQRFLKSDPEKGFPKEFLLLLKMNFYKINPISKDEKKGLPQQTR